MSEDYCELCDLPLSTCVHGMPAPPPPAPAAPRASTPRAPRAPKAPRAAARPSTRAVTSTPPARSVPRRWTPPDHLRAPILLVLQEAGGELDAEDVFTRLEERLGERLLAGDRETTPEGELRWRYAARRARQSLLADGLMAKGEPGRWLLTEAGRAISAGES